MNSLLKLIQYDKWANDRVLQYLGDASELSPRMLDLLSHILFAQEVWLARIKGRRYEKPEQAPGLADFPAAFQKCFDEYLEFLSWLQDDELDSVVEYADLKGNPWSSSLHDIILHVCNHGTYHRGQLALLCRDSGNVPLATDFIVMQREQSAAQS